MTSPLVCGIPIRGCEYLPPGMVVMATEGPCGLPAFKVMVKDGKVVAKIPKFNKKKFEKRVAVLKGLLTKSDFGPSPVARGIRQQDAINRAKKAKEP